MAEDKQQLEEQAHNATDSEFAFIDAVKEEI